MALMRYLKLKKVWTQGVNNNKKRKKKDINLKFLLFCVVIQNRKADLTCGKIWWKGLIVCCIIRPFCLRRWLLGVNQRFLFEPYAMKVARTVLEGGKPERAYLSWLFNSTIREKPYHNLYSILEKILQALHGCLQLMSWDIG